MLIPCAKSENEKSRPSPFLRTKSESSPRKFSPWTRHFFFEKLQGGVQRIRLRPANLTKKKTLRSSLAFQHPVNPILPSGPTTHLFQGVLLCLFVVHPASLHSRRDHVVIQLLKRQQFTFHVSTMNAIRIVEILSPMLLPRSQRPTTTLTLHRKGHRLTLTQQFQKH